MIAAARDVYFDAWWTAAIPAIALALFFVRSASRRPRRRRARMSEHLLTVTELTVTRPGAKRPELDRLSLAVDAGETLVILGEAGCGKEALMRVLAGAPDRDEIVDGTLQFGAHRRNAR
jgi:ABC-type transport system involved in cytochrome bd biosynthesis fused ATPase/permease subunit